MNGIRICAVLLALYLVHGTYGIYRLRENIERMEDSNGKPYTKGRRILQAF